MSGLMSLCCYFNMVTAYRSLLSALLPCASNKSHSTPRVHAKRICSTPAEPGHSASIAATCVLPGAGQRAAAADGGGPGADRHAAFPAGLAGDPGPSRCGGLRIQRAAGSGRRGRRCRRRAAAVAGARLRGDLMLLADGMISSCACNAHRRPAALYCRCWLTLCHSPSLV